MRGDRPRPPFFFFFLFFPKWSLWALPVENLSAAAVSVPLFQATNHVLDETGRVTPVTKKMELHESESFKTEAGKSPYVGADLPYALSTYAL